MSVLMVSMEQVAGLNAWQACGWVHPFTCGSGDRSDARHSAYQAEHGGDLGQLVAGPDGWVCPACGYRQTWANDFMAKGAPPDPFDLTRELDP